ncbi:hypothetical protein BYT27DRAFT_7188992 [Phlegmacium glaucopus]|nr:hypothetical protein BYT27DRAFT_7188992 [Phlegmacium glaucopus]
MRATAVLQALKTITMSIFQGNSAAQAFAQTRIHRHYALKNLEARGAEIAEVAPTEWHGEGGKSGNNKTGHLTVRFKKRDGTFVTTHHVYQDDSHY